MNHSALASLRGARRLASVGNDPGLPMAFFVAPAVVGTGAGALLFLSGHPLAGALTFGLGGTPLGYLLYNRYKNRAS